MIWSVDRPALVGLQCGEMAGRGLSVKVRCEMPGKAPFKHAIHKIFRAHAGRGPTGKWFMWPYEMPGRKSNA